MKNRFMVATRIDWSYRNSTLKISYNLELMRETERVRTFFPSSSFSRSAVRGFTYCARVVMVFVSDEWIPEPVKSTASTLKPPSNKRLMDLYQHQAPNPPPWTRIKWLVSIFSMLFGSCKSEERKFCQFQKWQIVSHIKRNLTFLLVSL